VGYFEFVYVETTRCTKNLICLVPSILMLSSVDSNKCRHIKKRVKQSRYRPGVAQRVPGSLGSQIS
jgi:hypothetical protein